jgi:hypothetical protein
MVCTQSQVLNVLLKSLLDKELIPQKTYEGATNIINSTLDFPEFFWYPVCCQEEEENNGCS